MRKQQVGKYKEVDVVLEMYSTGNSKSNSNSNSNNNNNNNKRRKNRTSNRKIQRRTLSFVSLELNIKSPTQQKIGRPRLSLYGNI